MANKPDIRVRLSPEGLEEVLEAIRKVQREGRRASEDTTAGIASMRKAVTGLRNAIAAVGVAKLFGAIIRETALTEQSLAQLDAALRSTGNAAGFNRDQLVAMAEDLSKRTIHSVNEIIEAQTRLLSYTTIRGKQFSAALQMAIDQAVRLGMTTAQSAELIGRALEKPSRGVVALTRQGFQFTEEQRKVMKALEESGRLADAQSMVLEVLAESYGGAAEAARNTLGGAITALKNNFADLLSAQDGVPAATEAVNEFAEQLKDPAFRSSAGVFTSGVVRAFGWMASFVTATAQAIHDESEKIAAAIHGPLHESFVGLDELESRIKQLEKLRDSSWRRTIPIGWSAQFRHMPTGQIDKIIEVMRQRADEMRRVAEEKIAPSVVDASEIGEEEESAETRKARLALESQRIQQEQRLLQQRVKMRGEADQRAYDQGLISLEQYYARRRALIEEEGRAEEAAIRRQIELTEQETAITPEEQIRQTAQLEKLRNDLTLRRLQTEQRLAALAGEQHRDEERRAEETQREQKRIADEQDRAANRLDELEGRRHAVFLRNLEREVKEIRELGNAAGQTADEIEAHVERVSVALTRQFQFDESQRAARAALEAFGRDADEIRRSQEAGIITQLEGENRLIDLQRRRLAVLQKMAAEMLAIAQASANPELIAQAQQYADSVAEIAASYQAATNAAAQYRQALESGLQSGIENLLLTLHEVESLEDAFVKLAQTVARSLGEIAAQQIARSATEGIMGLFGNGADAAQEQAQTAQLQAAAAQLSAAGATVSGGATATGAAATQLTAAGTTVTTGAAAVTTSATTLTTAGGSLVTGAAAVTQAAIQLMAAAQAMAAASAASSASGAGFADGGYTGPGDKYDAAGIVHAREFVLRREVVGQHGARAFLERFNRVGMEALRGYVEGGYVVGNGPSYRPATSSWSPSDASGGQTRATLAGVIAVDEGATFKLIDSDQFDEIVVRRMSRSPGRFRQAMGV